jgi:mRNA interferase MazF
MASSVERYAVYRVDRDPARGSEMAKTRPALVVSDDAMNRILSTVVVYPVTSRLHPRWPSRVSITIAGRKAEISIDQIRTIDKCRLGDRIDAIGESTASEVRHVITQMYGVLSVHA